MIYDICIAYTWVVHGHAQADRWLLVRTPNNWKWRSFQSWKLSDYHQLIIIINVLLATIILGWTLAQNLDSTIFVNKELNSFWVDDSNSQRNFWRLRLFTREWFGLLFLSRELSHLLGQHQGTEISLVLFLEGIAQVYSCLELRDRGKGSSSNTDKVLLNKRRCPSDSNRFRHIPNVGVATNPR